MELRVLQYFLAVAKEESISNAAKTLHLSQPTLSRQLKDLEDELGHQLFIRGNRKIILTEQGMLLRKRAEEITALVSKTEQEITQSENTIIGKIFIGAGETDAVRFLAKAMKCLQTEYPMISFHIQSGDKMTLLEWLDKGLIDFGLVFGSFDYTKYETLNIPYKDTYGVLMRKDSPLACKESIKAEDLWDKPLIVSRQEYNENILKSWIKKDAKDLNIVATYSLLFNGSLMVDEGVGYALCLDKIINTENSSLCFRPFEPRFDADMHIIWKKNQVHSKATQKFLCKLSKSKNDGWFLSYIESWGNYGIAKYFLNYFTNTPTNHNLYILLRYFVYFISVISEVKDNADFGIICIKTYRTFGINIIVK